MGARASHQRTDRDCRCLWPGFRNWARLPRKCERRHQPEWSVCCWLDCHWTLLFSQILVVVSACDPKGASEIELGEVVVVKARYVLIVGAGESLLGLDDFNSVSDSRSEAILRPGKALIGKLDILLGHFNLFF